MTGVERYFVKNFEDFLFFLAQGAKWVDYNEAHYFIDGIIQPEGYYRDKDNLLYAVDENGFLVTGRGWMTIDGDTYYNNNISFEHGISRIEDEVYLFDDDGKLQTQGGFVKYDNLTYYVNSDGTIHKGWLELDGKKYYFYEDYYYFMARGIDTAGDKLCQFDDDGVFQKYLTGWVQDESLYFNIIYYADSDSVFYTGWHEIDGKTYYFDSNGWMAINGTKQIGSDCYIFDSEGQYLTGWYKSYTRTYYLGTDGKARSGFQTIDGKRYYFTASGVWGSADYLQTGFFEVNKDLYYADEDGVLQTGWKKVDGNWYYFDKSTNKAIKNAFVESGDYEYHLDENGVMSIGWVKVVKDNKTYWYYCKETPHSDSDKGDKGSVMKNTWRKISGSWYYFDADGVMVTGWLDFKGDWYYLNPAVGNSEGKMLTGAQTINGVKYYFYTKADEDVYEGASEGAMAKNVTINGITYGANGKGQ